LIWGRSIPDELVGAGFATLLSNPVKPASSMRRIRTAAQPRVHVVFRYAGSAAYRERVAACGEFDNQTHANEMRQLVLDHSGPRFTPVDEEQVPLDLGACRGFVDLGQERNDVRLIAVKASGRRFSGTFEGLSRAAGVANYQAQIAGNDRRPARSEGSL
jgi:hypothetical protein